MTNSNPPSESFSEFVKIFEPVEKDILLMTDNRTGALYCECHIRGSKIVDLGTTDVPLDPDEQADYRANREIVENAPAYERMIDDARLKRSFSNIVAEYSKEFDSDHPLKIIGGQHRYRAIKVAFEEGVNELHGVKIYFDLNMDARLDVQLISNTNIAISGDLFDRMHETVMGPELRNWCQAVGLLAEGHDFADRRMRGGAISVQQARTFILSYFEGMKVDAKKFDKVETTPELCVTGSQDAEWESLRQSKPPIWLNAGLKRAGEAFAGLIKAQRDTFATAKKGSKPRPDFPEKALNSAIIASWAFVAGILHGNEPRLKRHFGLINSGSQDPLNAAALASGKHRKDPPNYRGLGYRTDAKERGRLTELFFLQAEKGDGIELHPVLLTPA